MSDSQSQYDQDSSDFIIRARGLPWSATPEDIASFFSDCEIVGGPDNGIHFTFSRDGRASGECFVELTNEDDMDNALSKHNKHMGKRYVEVFRSKRSEMEWVCKRMGPPAENEKESVVRLRGLPYGCTKEEISQFFGGLEIVPNGITITLDEDGRTSGEAYVEFASPEVAAAAMKKNKETIGHRYIEMFPSSKADIRFVYTSKPRPLMSARPGPYDRRGGGMGMMMGMGMGNMGMGGGGMGRHGSRESGFERRYRGGRGGGFGGGMFGGGGGYGGGYGNDFNNGFGGGRGGGGRNGRGRNRSNSGSGGFSTTGHTIHMRGLPFAAKENDVKQFFMPLNPVAVRMEMDSNGKCRGEADVDFATHSDAKAGMSKDKQTMGHRYIELFLRSNGDDGNWNSDNSFSNDDQGFNQQGNFGDTGMNSGGDTFSGGNFGGGNFGGDSGQMDQNYGVQNSGNFGGNMQQQNSSGNYGQQSGSGFGYQGTGNNFSGNQGSLMGSNQGNFGGNQAAGANFGGQNATNFSSGQNAGTYNNQSGFGTQASSGFANQTMGYTQNYNTGASAISQNPQSQQGGGAYNSQQQAAAYTDTSMTSAQSSFFGGGSFQGVKQESSGMVAPGTGQQNIVSYPGYQ